MSIYEISTKDFDFENKKYRLFIGKPNGVSDSKALQLLTLLDANKQFTIALDSVDHNKALPLIIGLGYPEEDDNKLIDYKADRLSNTLRPSKYIIAQRTRDYTFHIDIKKDDLLYHEQYDIGGGADDFMRFLQTQAMPYVYANFNIKDGEKYFFGHSFGALFGLYLILHKQDFFDFYTIASPSLWWGDGLICPKVEALQKLPHMLITIGEYEAYPENDPHINDEYFQKVKMRQSKISTIEFAKNLIKNDQVSFQMFEKQNHGGNIQPSLSACMAIIQSSKQKTES